METLTERNQHKDFEIFCRHLCERVICPNLRTQTGPEGGGDGKVDTETYAVAEEIAQRWFVGDANAATERWAFAMSAKEKWAPKVRSDVKGIIETGRKYDRIYFLTSRPVKAKRCHDIEKELTDKYGVPVTILDREWLIEKTIENGFEDLAYKDLGAGTYEPEKELVGPNDFRRNQELEEIEERIKKLGDERSDQTQLVSDTYEAARLSRNLERPRFETEGRYHRAINVANKSGSHDQVLRANYEYCWAMFWFHDDVEPMNRMYEEVENLALSSGTAADLSKVGNYLSVMSSHAAQNFETAEHLKLDERRARMADQLTAMSQNASQPNNALHAETLLVLMRLHDEGSRNDPEALESIWGNLDEIVGRSEGLAEFPISLIDDIVERISSMSPESEALDRLTETLAEFMGQREQDGKAGEIYLRRGLGKAKNEMPIDAIYWLGKASIRFRKDEYTEEQFNTLYYIAVAYRSAGLLWAARSTCLSALVNANKISSKNAETKIETIPTVSLLGMLSVQLGRTSDLILCMFWLMGLLQTLPLAKESKAHLEERITELDRLHACFIAGLPNSSIPVLSGLPDILDALGMYQSEFILLYRLGWGEKLVEMELIPEGTEVSEVADMTSLLAAQPARSSMPKALGLNQGHAFQAQTTIIGVEINFHGGDTLDDVLLCQTCLTAVESFMATAFRHQVFPRVERLDVFISLQIDLEEVSIELDESSSRITVMWPQVQSVLNSQAVMVAQPHLLELCALVLSAISMMPETEKSLDQMVTQEEVLERALSFSFAHFALERVMGTNASSLDDFEHLREKSYPPIYPLPDVVPQSSKQGGISQSNEWAGSNEVPDEFETPQSHKAIKSCSIINLPLWDKAGWQGVLYAHNGAEDQQPPMLGLVLSDRDAATGIFKEWNKKFGRKDVDDQIRISIIRGVKAEQEHHYRVHISRSIENGLGQENPGSRIYNVSRIHNMEPESSENLEMFLEQFNKFGMFFLIPVVVSESASMPDLLIEHSILCRNLHVRYAYEIGQHDPDSVVIKDGDNIVQPDEV
ncbi:hypothetical protein [Pseudovibrio sp. FO-BEG1]|uniref:hypothetical protein n=1 Tax=Pseudovibrio sp. (strain FO-BEG1) TaxID=911045 RepID=UPI0011D28931|nr:hypothetical protein [Pseudovibrio sp. FO-BEG1]